MNKDKICAVIVTYNRPDLLLKCLNSVVEQTHKLDAIFIINNASTDNTESVLQNGNFILKNSPISYDEPTVVNFRNKKNENIEIYYVRKKINDGGAGGFNFGLRLAKNYKFDWFWIMDDDGLPHLNCLENLFAYAKTEVNDYIAPNLLNFEGVSHFKALFDSTDLAVINYYGGPFNGILLSSYLIEKIGYPIKEFFIWGDEMEYVDRIKCYGFNTITVRDAIHIHKSTGFKFSNVPRVFFYTRNLIFQYRLHGGLFDSRKLKAIIVTSLISKILFAGLFNFNFRQVKDCFRGLYFGFKDDVKKYQDTAKM